MRIFQCASSACEMRSWSKRGIWKGSEWGNEEVERLMKNKWDVYKMWLENKCSETYKRYKMVKIEVKRVVRRAKKKADLKWGEK